MSYHDDDFQEMTGRAAAFPIPEDVNDDMAIATGYGDAMEPGTVNRPILLSRWPRDERIRYRIGARLAFGYIKRTDLS